jgi:Uma2 family endonuclease
VPVLCASRPLALAYPIDYNRRIDSDARRAATARRLAGAPAMATGTTRIHPPEIGYPTSDGRPMAETDIHFRSISEARGALELFFASEPLVYVSGNLLVFYEPGNRRKHVAPDILVAKGVRKQARLNYLIWEERHGLDAVFEFTSKSTRHEDVEDKYWIYEQQIKVPEYFLFDPLEEYLEPSLQGFRLRRGKYAPIRPVKGRLPSQVLGLQVEREGTSLRFYNPATGLRLPTPAESLAMAEAARLRVEAENTQLKRELDALRRRRSQHDS